MRDVPFFLMPKDLVAVEEAVGFAPASPTVADIVVTLWRNVVDVGLQKRICRKEKRFKLFVLLELIPKRSVGRDDRCRRTFAVTEGWRMQW